MTISCRAAQAAMSPLLIAVAIKPGKRSGVHAKLGSAQRGHCDGQPFVVARRSLVR